MTSSKRQRSRSTFRTVLLLPILVSAGCAMPRKTDPVTQPALLDGIRISQAAQPADFSESQQLPPPVHVQKPALARQLAVVALPPAPMLDVQPAAAIRQTAVRTVGYARDTPQTSQPTLPSSAYNDASTSLPGLPPIPIATHENPTSTAAVAVSQITMLPEVAPMQFPGEPTGVLLDVDAGQVIDLGSALGMAGGNAWAVQLARQKTVEAHADLLTAKAMWLPSLQVGVGWNKHDGRIQSTAGDVIEASRGSFFAGGGSTWGSAPVAGGSGGPLRLSGDLALADAYFGTQIAERMLCAQRQGVSVARNKTLLRAGLAYVDLVEASGQVADSGTAIMAASELVALAEQFEKAGEGAQADVDRARTEVSRLEGLRQEAMRIYEVRSATLARALRLDPRFHLVPADQVIVPIPLCDASGDLDSDIGLALSSRPEFLQLRNQIAALDLGADQAFIAPWIPRVAMTASAGSFGGGQGSALDNTAGRTDLDLHAVWEVDSLGLGVKASRRRAQSRLAQGKIRLAAMRDDVTAEVVRAHENVNNYQQQIATADRALDDATSSYTRNLARIRAAEGLPIELLQAIQARATGLAARTKAVSNFNRAQLELAYASGQLSQ